MSLFVPTQAMDNVTYVSMLRAKDLAWVTYVNYSAGHAVNMVLRDVQARCDFVLPINLE